MNEMPLQHPKHKQDRLRSFDNLQFSKLHFNTKV